MHTARRPARLEPIETGGRNSSDYIGELMKVGRIIQLSVFVYIAHFTSTFLTPFAKRCLILIIIIFFFAGTGGTQ